MKIIHLKCDGLNYLRQGVNHGEQQEQKEKYCIKYIIFKAYH